MGRARGRETAVAGHRRSAAGIAAWARVAGGPLAILLALGCGGGSGGDAPRSEAAPAGGLGAVGGSAAASPEASAPAAASADRRAAAPSPAPETTTDLPATLGTIRAVIDGVEKEWAVPRDHAFSPGTQWSYFVYERDTFIPGDGGRTMQAGTGDGALKILGPYLASYAGDDRAADTMEIRMQWQISDGGYMGELGVASVNYQSYNEEGKLRAGRVTTHAGGGAFSLTRARRLADDTLEVAGTFSGPMWTPGGTVQVANGRFEAVLPRVVEERYEGLR